MKHLHKPTRVFKKFIAFIGAFPVYFYRWAISPLLPKSCGFYPTCSHFAIGAIKRHGFIVGWAMTAKRLCRCNPFTKRNHGYDPVRWKLRGGAKWVV